MRILALKTFVLLSISSKDQEQWDLENLNKDEIKEWDNPYYGFPQMIRFAFNPNESSRKKMEEMKKNGVTYAFSELFKPQSITIDKEKKLHKKFNHNRRCKIRGSYHEYRSHDIGPDMFYNRTHTGITQCPCGFNVFQFSYGEYLSSHQPGHIHPHT